MEKQIDFSKGERGKFSNTDGEFHLPNITKYDVVEYLRTPEEINAYLEACLEEANGDHVLIAKAHDNVSKAQINTKQ